MIPFFVILACVKGKGDKRYWLGAKRRTNVCADEHFFFLLIHVHVKSDFQTYV